MPFNIRPSVLADAVQVCVWNNINVAPGIPGAHIGHAAAQLYRFGGRDELISWWPDDGANKLGGPVRGRADSQLSRDAQSEMSDETRTWLRIGVYRPRPGQIEAAWRQGLWPAALGDRQWIQLPDAIIEIPGMSKEGPLWGLNIRQMARWWGSWATKNQMYQMVSTTNNCSGAVWQALVAGEACHIVNPPHHAVFVTPLNVRAWSSSLADRLNSLNARTVFTNDAVSQFMASTLGALNVYQYKGNVMSVDTWKQISALNWTQPRSPMVRNIDSSLSAYHNASGDMDKYFALANVMDAICQFRESKPDSKRMTAVLVLAKHVINKAREISSAYAT